MRGFGRLLILVVVRKFSVVHRGHSVVLPERPIRQPHHSSSRVNIEHRQLVFGQQRARRLLQALALRQSCRFGKPAKPPPLPQAAIRRRHCNQGAAFQKRPDQHAIELRQTAQPARQSLIGLQAPARPATASTSANGHTASPTRARTLRVSATSVATTLLAALDRRDCEPPHQRKTPARRCRLSLRNRVARLIPGSSMTH